MLRRRCTDPLPEESERQQRQQAEQQTEQERLARLQAEQQAARLAAYLHTQGIDPDELPE